MALGARADFSSMKEVKIRFLEYVFPSRLEAREDSKQQSELAGEIDHLVVPA